MRRKFDIYYYISKSGENPVKKFIDSLSNKQKAKIFRLFQTYQDYGLRSIIPHTKKIARTKLWEVRIQGRDNIRILYIVKTQSALLVLHGFMKKTQKTPNKEKAIALERYKNWRKTVDKKN